MSKIYMEAKQKYSTVLIKESLKKPVKEFCVANDLTIQEFINGLVSRELTKNNKLKRV